MTIVCERELIAERHHRRLVVVGDLRLTVVRESTLPREDSLIVFDRDQNDDEHESDGDLRGAHQPGRR